MNVCNHKCCMLCPIRPWFGNRTILFYNIASIDICNFVYITYTYIFRWEKIVGIFNGRRKEDFLSDCQKEITYTASPLYTFIQKEEDKISKENILFRHNQTKEQVWKKEDYRHTSPNQSMNQQEGPSQPGHSMVTGADPGFFSGGGGSDPVKKISP
jgi:hypothetical protein